jgi:hypothetical protein
VAGAPRGDRAVRGRPRAADAGRAPARDRGGRPDRHVRARPVEAPAANLDLDLHAHVRHEGRGRRRGREDQSRPHAGQRHRSGHGKALRRARPSSAAVRPRLPGGLGAPVRRAHGRQAGRCRQAAVPRGADARGRDVPRAARHHPADRAGAPGVDGRRRGPRRAARDRQRAEGRPVVPRSSRGGGVAARASRRVAPRVRDAAAPRPRDVRVPASRGARGGRGRDARRHAAGQAVPAAAVPVPGAVQRLAPTPAGQAGARRHRADAQVGRHPSRRSTGCCSISTASCRCRGSRSPGRSTRWRPSAVRACRSA